MANETKLAFSAAWHTVIASATTNDGAFDAGTKTALDATSMSADEEVYPLLDFHLDMTATSGTNTENSTIDLYAIPNANSAASPTPSGSYSPHYLGSFVLDNVATQDLYLLGVPNIDPHCTFITENNSGATSNTYSVSVQAKTYAPVA